MTTYSPNITQTQAREIIKAADREYVIDAAKRFANCLEADVDEQGDVWVANPCGGHWLADEKLCFFGEAVRDGQ